MRNNKRTEIINYIDNLVRVHEVACIEHISEVDRDLISALYIQDDQTLDFMTCEKHYDEIYDLTLKSLMTANSSYHHDLIEAIKKNAFAFYKSDIERLISNAVENYDSEKFGDYVAIRAKDNGEPLRWGRYS